MDHPRRPSHGPPADATFTAGGVSLGVSLPPSRDRVETAREVKHRPREGGLGGGAEMTTGARPVVRGAVELFFAGERLEDDKTLHEQASLQVASASPRWTRRFSSRAPSQTPRAPTGADFAHASAHRQTLVLR